MSQLVVLLPWLWRCERTCFWFALPAGLLPALTNWFFSYTRYIMRVFPLFVALADLLYYGRRPRLYYLYGGAALIVQVILLYRFLNCRWAGLFSHGEYPC